MRLPAGYVVMDSWGGWDEPYDPFKHLPKCECGVSIAMGEGDHPSMHSDYCPIRKEYERNKELYEIKKSDK